MKPLTVQDIRDVVTKLRAEPRPYTGEYYQTEIRDDEIDTPEKRGAVWARIAAMVKADGV